MKALKMAIEIAGSQLALAQNLGIKSPSIDGWRKRHKVPAERCAQIETLSHGRVTRAMLRPDLFADPHS